MSLLFSARFEQPRKNPDQMSYSSVTFSINAILKFTVLQNSQFRSIVNLVWKIYKNHTNNSQNKVQKRLKTFNRINENMLLMDITTTWICLCINLYYQTLNKICLEIQILNCLFIEIFDSIPETLRQSTAKWYKKAKFLKMMVN